jgi:hypothetical protein
MTSTIRAVVYLLIAVMGCASMAMAEGCAWVLWMRVQATSIAWDPLDAHTTHAGCLYTKSGLWERSTNNLKAKVATGEVRNLKIAGDEMLSYTTRDGWQVTQTMRCLPDTVDPRQPSRP